MEVKDIDRHLLKAYGMWGKNRVEFNRDSRITLFTVVLNQELTFREVGAIHRCVGGNLITPAPGFVSGPGKRCYLVARGCRVGEVIKELEQIAPVEIYLHERVE